MPSPGSWLGICEIFFLNLENLNKPKRFCMIKPMTACKYYNTLMPAFPWLEFVTTKNLQPDVVFFDNCLLSLCQEI